MCPGSAAVRGSIVGMISAWQSSIAQPDLADWVTVAAYLIAAMLTAQAAGCALLRRLARERMLWRIATLALILLGINELLDLQTLLTSIGRAHAKANGWYEKRQAVQNVFVIGLGSGALLVGAGPLWLMKDIHAALRVAFAGFVFIGLFVLARASSIHHLELAFESGPSMFNAGSIQEMVGILIVAAAAARYIQTQRPRA